MTKPLGISSFLDLPWRSYKLTFVRPFVRPSVCYQLFSRLAHQFLLIFDTKMQNSNAQNVSEPDFRKKFITGRKCLKYAGKASFWHFLEISSLVFSDFSYQQCLKHGRVRFSRKFLFRRKMPEIAVFADFHRTFS